MSNLGTVVGEAGRLDEAITYHRQALDLFRMIGDRHSEGAALTDLGNTYRLQRRLEEARRALEQAVAVFENTGAVQSADTARRAVQKISTVPDSAEQPAKARSPRNEEAVSADAEIRVSGGNDVEETASLQDWLMNEPALADAVRSVQQLTAPGEMVGARLVGLTSGSAGVAVAALAAWLRTRRSNVTVTVTSSGRSVTLSAGLGSEVLPLLEDVLQEPDDR